MARPREFDEHTALDAAMQCFWANGYDATSIRDLAACMGITGASLYNTFGDKHSLYRAALDRYVDLGIVDRIARCGTLAPRDAIAAFFDEIVERSLRDPDRKGCLLVNTAIDLAPHDHEIQTAVAAMLERIESFFRRSIEAGRRDGSIGGELSPPKLAKHLLATLMGIRVLARVRPEPALLRDIASAALSVLNDPSTPRSLR